MARQSNKEQILDAGLHLVWERGYAGAGVRDITRAAGVPQGSFTNHFRSKEAFGQEIVERYFDGVRSILEETFGDTSRPPLERLRSYFDTITERFRARDWQNGCLVGNFSLEAAQHSDAIRSQLAAIFAEWRQPFARCLDEARTAGDIHTPVPSDDLADFLLASWQGAILRVKVEQSGEPFERFKDVVFGALLV
jgi:TetR/AcrR family transcriptional repressor of nem operon